MYQYIRMNEKNRNDLQEILTQALNEIKDELGEKFNIDKVNLAELERRTGISRGKLRGLKANKFVVKPHGLSGRTSNNNVIEAFSGILNDLLSKGVSNASVCYGRICEVGYAGSKSAVKNYVKGHKYLIPAKRQIVSPQGNRGRRYETGPGESYQMDWGFVTVDTANGKSYKIACFAMICHHCGQRYIEFFPNAKQENLFIGMIHAFMYMGVPRYVLTDNMKSVVIKRDYNNKPIWQKDYELFMGNIGFDTKLCKPRHPFTKGAVERLVRFVKENFLAGRIFTELTDLNYDAIRWCNAQNAAYHRAVDCIPNDKHSSSCIKVAPLLEASPELSFYLCPPRCISFDGFVTYEGRRFGVPYWYTEKTCRVKRDGYVLYIYDYNMTKILTSHDVTWSRRDSYCRDQYLIHQEEETPTAPITTRIKQIDPPEYNPGFSKYNFEEDCE